jgi:two-component sensor histidine kinase
MPIQRRLNLLVILAVLPALAIQTHSAWRAFHDRQQALRGEAQQLAIFVTGELDRFIEAQRAAMVALAELPALQQRDVAACSAFAARLVAHLPALPGIGAYDADGNMFCTSLPIDIDKLGPAGNFANAPWFTEARQKEKFSVGVMIKARLSGRTSLPLTLPMHDQHGRFAGVTSAAVDIPWLNQYFAAKELPPDTTMVIADRDGTILVLAPLRAGVVGTKLPPDVQRLMSAAAPSATQSNAIDGIDRFIGYVPLDLSPQGLFIAVGIDRAKAVAPLWDAVVRDFVLLLLTIALALAAARFAGDRFIRRPIERITDAARRWRAGERASRTGIADKGTEIGELGSTFDAMADAIQANEQNLQAQIAARDEALAHKALLTDELNHRVKNTLATVQAIAHLTLRLDNPDAPDDFSARLRAMAAAHAMLTRESWSGAALAEIVADAIEPYADGDEDRFTAAGPAVRLPPRAALAMAMGLHELCTNAAKHGALSTGGGRVEISWTVDHAAERLHLVWRENGGPVVTPPSRRGFGTTVIERMLSRELGGKVKLEFEPKGLVCEIEAALHEAEPTPGAAPSAPAVPS